MPDFATIVSESEEPVGVSKKRPDRKDIFNTHGAAESNGSPVCVLVL